MNPVEYLIRLTALLEWCERNGHAAIAAWAKKEIRCTAA